MARAVQGGFFAGRRFYIYSRVDFLKIRGSAVLRSKMPACSGQADPCRRQARFCEAKCPHAAGKQTPAGGRRGFAKQNARLQRAGRPLPEAGAALRSKMPACSGQADPCRRQARLCEAKCPLAAGRRQEIFLAVARRPSCPAAQSGFAPQFWMRKTAKPPMAAIRLALGAGCVLC